MWKYDNKYVIISSVFLLCFGKALLPLLFYSYDRKEIDKEQETVMNIQISSNCIDSQDLKQLLEQNLDKLHIQKDELILTKENAINRNMDPFFLWLVTTVGTAMITITVERIAAWWLDEKGGDKVIVMMGENCIQIDQSSDYQIMIKGKPEETIEIRLIKKE